MKSPTARPRRRALAAVAGLALLPLAACSEEAGPHLELTAALPEDVPDDVVLRVGDPTTQVALEESGLIDELDFEVEWANVSGGPRTLEAFRADALDIGAVADIPPLFAHWTGTDVRIVSARTTVDPLEHPTYELGISPDADVTSLDDLAGTRIAYSPGQAQGALVLRVLENAGLSPDDVELVEMTSVDDTFSNALASGQVDVAPLGVAQSRTYLAKYEPDGARTIPPGVRDDFWHLYTPVEVLEDAHKAAAIAQYVEVWQQAVAWVNDHPEEFAQAYYVDHEGLTAEDAAYVVDALGTFEVPQEWATLVTEHQATADLVAEAQGRDQIDVDGLYDHRYEPATLASDEAAR
ncbi:ABC transporter substrate-binding protein [Nocardioides zeae]|uniref:Sulfonate transport system substrate-binding protein n=1 Tax=Nocardioides zeae TaxID=1457234 RepID=A0AAJ1X139_9ACTN|nr:ABC transporter substrate-binding protein [Nocardioides zeae]MDQ1103014.1 sulfonate transport system substrate-binding protein [Nocardioides zeae]